MNEPLNLAVEQVEPSMFDNDIYRSIWQSLCDEMEKNRHVPTMEVIYNQDTENLIIEAGCKLQVTDSQLNKSIRSLYEEKGEDMVQNKKKKILKEVAGLDKKDRIEMLKALLNKDTYGISLQSTIQEILNDDTASVKLSTGISTLDELIDGGIKWGQLVTMAGVSCSGKTTLTTQIVTHMANTKSGYIPVRFYSWDMSKAQLAEVVVRQNMMETNLNFPPKPGDNLNELNYALDRFTDNKWTTIVRKMNVETLRNDMNKAAASGTRIFVIDHSRHVVKNGKEDEWQMLQKLTSMLKEVVNNYRAVLKTSQFVNE